MTWRYLVLFGLAAMVFPSAGCGEGSTIAGDAAIAVDADAGSAKADGFLQPDATNDASVADDAATCIVDASQRPDVARNISIAADADAPIADAPLDSDAVSGDGGGCIGIANCLNCRCMPGLCIAGNAVGVTTCTPPEDRGVPPLGDGCGCDCRTCDAGLTCVRVYHPPPYAVGGGGGSSNGCFELCRSDADCSGGRLCRTNLHGIDVCVDPPACLSDADCTADGCGHCVPKVQVFHAGLQILDRTKMECTYEGPCAAGSCITCRRDPSRGSYGSLHLCTP